MPMHRAMVFLSLLLPSMAVARQELPATAPAATAQSPADTFAVEQRDAIKQMLTETPASPERPIAELLRFDIANGHLTIELIDPAPAERTAFTVNGDADHAFVLESSVVPLTPPLRMFQAHGLKYQPKLSRALSIELLPTPGRTNVTFTIQTPRVIDTVQLLDQSPMNADVELQEGVARLYLQRTGDDATTGANAGPNDPPEEARFNFTEGSFAEIVEKHHDDALALLGEGLTDLRAMHVMAGVSQADAKAVFDAHREVDANTRKELEQIVEAVRHNGSAAVVEARPRLRKLGASAAMVLSRMPRDGWSADLSLNIDALTAGLLPGANEQSIALLGSPGRLIDLLYARDVAVRRDAKERLEKLTRQTIELDVAADPYTKVEAIEALRPKTAETTARE